MNLDRSRLDLEPVQDPKPPKWAKAVLMSLAIAAAIWAVIAFLWRAVGR
jgi:hypothetical protein